MLFYVLSYTVQIVELLMVYIVSSLKNTASMGMIYPWFQRGPIKFWNIE